MKYIYIYICVAGVPQLSRSGIHICSFIHVFNKLTEILICLLESQMLQVCGCGFLV
jgi:hypothetical protein